MLENPDFAIVDHIICILLNVASRRFEDHLLCSACHRKNHLHNRRFCRAYWRLKSPNCSHHLSQYLMHFKSRRGLLNQGKSILSAHFFNDGTKYVNYPWEIIPICSISSPALQCSPSLSFTRVRRWVPLSD